MCSERSQSWQGSRNKSNVLYAGGKTFPLPVAKLSPGDREVAEIARIAHEWTNSAGKLNGSVVSLKHFFKYLASTNGSQAPLLTPETSVSWWSLDSCEESVDVCWVICVDVVIIGTMSVALHQVSVGLFPSAFSDHKHTPLSSRLLWDFLLTRVT